MNVETRIQELGIQLPDEVMAGAAYTPVKQTGNLLYVSGQIPTINGKLIYTGKIGNEMSIEHGKKAATLCTINMLATVRNFLGNLNDIKDFVKIQVFVNSETGFTDQHIVADTASNLLSKIFGEKGKHARTTIGINQLPMDVSVEIDAVIEVN